MIRTVVLSLCLYLSYYTNAYPQTNITLFTDVGSTNVTQEYFLKSATMGQYSFGKNQVEAGFLFNLKTTNENTLGGYQFQASRDLSIKNWPFKIQGFWLQTIFSDLLRETNWGIALKKPTKHFEILIGTEFRTYAFRDDAIQTYGIENEATKMHENFNLIYSVGFNLKPPENIWNAGLSVTNFDYFFINQETNPILCLKGSYKFKAPISLISQFWFEESGIANVYANYYGFYFRTGIIWYIQ
jgi:hypothetical protein